MFLTDAPLRPFVGRACELDALRTAVEDSHAGRGSLVLVAGEAGIGKTRLVEQAAASAALAGSRVVWGRCRESGGAQPYWPWVQVVGELHRQRWPSSSEPGGTELATLVGGPGGDPAGPTRYAMFDATTTFLASSASAAPILIVLDDLHAADQASALLLRFVTRALPDLPVLVVVTFRPGASEVPHQIDEVARLGHLLRLGGLTRDEVSDLVTALGGTEDAGAVHRRTGGHPLFVGEVLGSTGRREVGDGGTDGLLATIRSQLESLPADTLRVLQAGAVLGREFDLDTAADLAGCPSEAAERALGAGIEPGIVRPLASRARGYRFVHTLMRDATYARFDPPGRRRAHAAAADLLDGTDRVPEVAHHLLAALPGADPKRVALAVLAAGERAEAHLAEGEAASLYRRGLEVVADHWLQGTGTHGELLRRLAAITVRRGEMAEADELFHEAEGVARDRGDGVGLAEAVVERRPPLDVVVGPESEVIGTEEALQTLPSGDHPLRVQLLAQLATRHGRSGGARDEPVALAEQALAMADRLGQPGPRASALLADAIVRWGPDTLRPRLDAANQVVELARRVRSAHLLELGQALRTAATLELGDITVLDGEIEAHGGVVEGIVVPRVLRHAHVLRATRAVIDGRLDDAEDEAERALDIGHRIGQADAVLTYGAQISAVRYLQGRLPELEPLYRLAIRMEPDMPVWSAALSCLLARDGRLDEAQAEYEPLVAGLAGLRRDVSWTVTVSSLGDVAAELGDRAGAEILYRELRPFADRCLVFGLGAVFEGSLARVVGRLAATLRRPDEAAGLFAEAAQVDTRIGAWPWLVEAKLDEAASPGVGTDRARSLVEESLGLSRALALVGLTRRAEALVEGMGLSVGDPATPVPVRAGITVTERSTSPTPISTLRADDVLVTTLGRFAIERVTADGGTVAVSWGSRQPRTLVKILLARRGRAVPRDVLIDLLWPGTDPELAGRRLSVALSTARRSLDPDRHHPADWFLRADRAAVTLVAEHLDIDVERLLVDVALGTALGRDGHQSEAISALRAATELYRGPFLEEEQYEDWSAPRREEARSAFLAGVRALAAEAAAAGSPAESGRAYLRLLEEDPYDEDAHRSLIALYEAAGSHGEAHRQQEVFARRRQELDLPVG